MGQDTRDHAGSADRLGEATEDTHNTLARRIMVCGYAVADECTGINPITQKMLGVVNGMIIDCVADCIDILRGEKHDASVNNS